MHATYTASNKSVNRTCAEMAAVSCDTSHVTTKECLSTPFQLIFKTLCVKLQSLVQSCMGLEHSESAGIFQHLDFWRQLYSISNTAQMACTSPQVSTCRPWSGCELCDIQGICVLRTMGYIGNLCTENYGVYRESVHWELLGIQGICVLRAMGIQGICALRTMGYTRNLCTENYWVYKESVYWELWGIQGICALRTIRYNRESLHWELLGIQGICALRTIGYTENLCTEN